MFRHFFVFASLLVAATLLVEASAQDVLGWPDGRRHVTPDLIAEWPVIGGGASTLRPGDVAARARSSTDADFYVRDLFSQDRWVMVHAQLAVETQRVALWVESSQWDYLESAGLLAPLIDSLAISLESNTSPGSTSPARGVVDLLSETFAAPPDVDGSNRIDYLLLDIQDDYDRTGQYVAGFFDPVNLTDHPSSNRRDMVYLDTYPTAVRAGRLYPEEIAATAAHETTHLIQSAIEANGPDLTFINEGLAELAEIICGFRPRSAEPFLRAPPTSLLSWNRDSPLADYARASLFMHYLYEQEGVGVVRSLFASPARGVDGLSDALRSGSGRSVPALLNQWARALTIADRTQDARWGYAHRERAGIRLSSQLVPDLPAAAAVDLPPLSFSAYRFPAVGDLSFSSASTALASALVHAGRAEPGQGAMVSWTSMSDAHESPEVVLVNGTDAQITETWFADGTPSGFSDAYRYDDGTPDPYSGAASLLRVRAGAPVAVTFGSIPGFQPRSVSTYGLFESELEGSELSPDAPRAVRVQLFEWLDGRPGRPLTSALDQLSLLDYGTMGTIELSVSLSAGSLPDSFCVVVATPPAPAPNDFLIGLDLSERDPVTHSAVYDPVSGAWRSFETTRAAGAPLAGRDAMVWVDGVAAARPASARSADVAFEGGVAVYSVLAPFPVDPERSRAFAVAEGGAPYRLDLTADGDRAVVRVPLDVGGPASSVRVRLRAFDQPAFTDTTLAWPRRVSYRARLSGVAPNPSSGRATAWIDLDEPADVAVEVFDMLGRVVLRSDHPALRQGRHLFPVVLGDAAPGTYLVRLTASGADSAHTHTIQHVP